jgi:hypothetical protein
MIGNQVTGSYTKIRPTNVGGGHDIPDDICAMARLDRNDVIAWTTFDSEYQRRIGPITCCRAFGKFFFCPCFLPHMIVLFPCICAGKVTEERRIKNTYWVLTTSDLKVIIKNHDLPGCYHVGDKITSIPYDAITDCTTVAPACDCFDCCTLIPTVYVVSGRYTCKDDTGKSIGTSPNIVAVGYGLAGYDWFVSEILSRRDILKGNNQHEPQAMEMSNMDRGTNVASEADESRIQKLKELHKLGYISTGEYEKKRQEINASL